MPCLDRCQHRGGCEKAGNYEFQRFLQIASGSARELDYELLLAKDLGYLASSEHLKVSDEVSQIQKMLSALLRKVETERKG
jgi:four helix bundle protein